MGLGGLLQALVAAPRIVRQAPRLRARRGTVLLGAVAVAAYPLAFYILLLCAGQAAGAPGGAERTSTAATVFGVGLGLVAATTYALYSWAAHRLITQGVASRAAMGAVFGVGGLLLVPVLLVTGAPLLDSGSNVAVGAYMALVPMFAGYVLFGWGLANVPASTATTLSLLEPAVGWGGYRTRPRLSGRPHRPGGRLGAAPRAAGGRDAAAARNGGAAPRPVGPGAVAESGCCGPPACGDVIRPAAGRRTSPRARGACRRPARPGPC